MPTCDCSATQEELAAGIHAPNCTRPDGDPDDASDHYDL